MDFCFSKKGIMSACLQQLKFVVKCAFAVGALLIAFFPANADKIRDKIPANIREMVEPYQNEYTYLWLNYLMYIPPDYVKTTKKYPLILYFHGAGQKGAVVSDLTFCCLNKQLEGEKKKNFPFIVVSPQLPGPRGFSVPHSLDRGTWYYRDYLEVVNKLLSHLVEAYAVDESRIYCVGASMGGAGTWKMASMFPERFAAIAPLCGEGNPADACKVKDIPIWVFHCEDDEIMPVKGSDEMVEALKACGGKVEYKREKGGDHEECWSNDFDDLYKWLLKHKK
jgi:predicted peptidase